MKKENPRFLEGFQWASRGTIRTYRAFPSAGLPSCSLNDISRSHLFASEYYLTPPYNGMVLGIVPIGRGSLAGCLPCLPSDASETTIRNKYRKYFNS